MELLIPEEMSPISFRSSCFDNFCPEKIKAQPFLKSGAEFIEHYEVYQFHLTSKSYWQQHCPMYDHARVTHTLYQPPACESPPLGDTSGGSLTPGSWAWWSTADQIGARYTETSPLERTSDSGAWWKGTLQNAREREKLKGSLFSN